MGNRRTVAVRGEEALTLVQRLVERQEEFEREHEAFHLDVQQRHRELLEARNRAVTSLMARIGGLCGVGEDVTAAWTLHLEFFEEHGAAFLKEAERPKDGERSLMDLLTDPQGTMQ